MTVQRPMAPRKYRPGQQEQEEERKIGKTPGDVTEGARGWEVVMKE